jgi:hypothetical protein
MKSSMVRANFSDARESWQANFLDAIERQRYQASRSRKADTRATSTLIPGKTPTTKGQ